MDVRSAAAALGGDVSNRSTILCPGPGHNRQDRSLSVTFDPSAPDGFLVHSFANDDWQSCRDHVRYLLGLESFRPGQGAPARVAFKPAPRPETTSAHGFALKAWQEARPICGTIAETYLHSRGIIIPREIEGGDAIRFHPECTFKLDSGEYVRLPAMVAAVVDIRSNDFLALHRTALKPDGSGKASVAGMPSDGRMMLGSNRGGVVKLSPDDAVTYGLGIGEGLETCLSVMGNFGFRPMWATLTTSILAKFEPLPGVDFLTIWADADKTKVNPATGRASTPGIDAARECGARWVMAGAEGEILTPPILTPDGKADFNDLAQARAAA